MKHGLHPNVSTRLHPANPRADLVLKLAAFFPVFPLLRASAIVFARRPREIEEDDEEHREGCDGDGATVRWGETAGTKLLRRGEGPASRALIGGHCSVSAQEIREATKRFPPTQSRFAGALARQLFGQTVPLAATGKQLSRNPVARTLPGKAATTRHMTEQDAGRRTHRAGAGFIFALLLFLFAGSGCAALIYEIVWFQLLELVIGSSAVSLAVLLGTYMGGLCLGSIVLPRVISPRRNPLRVYAALEAGIGVFGIAVLLALPWVARFYVVNVGHGFAAILLRGAVSAVCLLPPTVLMGATLPAISRWVETTPQGVSRLGFFYGGNIAGAVFGCLFAGFYLLRVHDTMTATYVAAAINGMVALLGFGLAAEIGFEPEIQDAKPAQGAPGSSLVCGAIALSGFCALGAEVVWTRLLSLLLGPTVYAFSVILAVFLVGLAIGSGLGSMVARRTHRARLALGGCQLLLMAAIAWTAFMLARSLPYWPVNPALSRSLWFNFQLDLVRCFWAILPPTVLWGASFPLALAASAAPGQDPGRMVGKVYAANTMGAILGAIVTSLVLITWLGTQHAQQVLIGCSGLASLLMILLWLRPATSHFAREAACAGDIRTAADRGGFLTKASSRFEGRRLATAALPVGIAGLAITLIWGVPQIPWQLVADGRYLPTYNDDRKILYVGEGMNASVAVTETSGGIRNFHISGKVEASTNDRDMRMQRMLGHVPALVHPRPRSVLVVGCGAGVTAGSLVNYPEVERIVICEIEPLVPRAVAPYFQKQNYSVLQDPRVQVVYDDARNFVHTTKEKFDVITSDSIHPWVKGAATLYTKEYFETCKQHLNRGGVFTQWIPLYESDARTVKSELATFFAVFPEGTLWSNDESGGGYDAVVLGGADPVTINVDALQERLDRNRALAQSLRDVGFKSAIGLLSTYAGQGPDLKPCLRLAEINRDSNLRLQYLAGMAANFYRESAIYEELVFYRRYPEKLFTGSAASTQALREAIKGTRARR
jgi:spermidine synthase